MSKSPDRPPTAERAVASPRELPTPISMSEAVGYPSIDCAHEASLEDVLVLKHDRLFFLTDKSGNVAPPGRCGLGLFFDDTRVLSHYALSVAGEAPALLSAQVISPSHVVVDLAVSNLLFGGEPWDAKNVIHLRREFLLDERLVEQLTLTSYLTRPVDCELVLALACDFADIFEVRGWARAARGEFYVPTITGRSLEFLYRGRDGRMQCARIAFRDAPAKIERLGARWTIRLEPGADQVLEWEIEPCDEHATPRHHVPIPVGRRRLAEEYNNWRIACVRWQTDVAEFNATLGQAVDDLRALYIGTDHGDVISAGIPWYTTAFGRDAIITSLQTLSLNPRIARDTLRYLARYQGTKEDPFTEEQPGKIMHELRRGEMARAGEIPHLPYYGTIDATPLWLILLCETWRWTADAALVGDLLPAARRALAWIDRYGDVDGDGLIEYARTSEKGLANQGWKDSGDGVPYPDGRLPAPPIALVEVQGYVYDAKVRMAELYEAFGEPARAVELRREAALLRARIRDRYWLDELGTFALALDGDKRPLPTITTNAGHLLWSRVPDATEARRMAELFSAPTMFSGWGIRTLSAAHPVYNPMSYHNGSIWPHDNALVVLGLSLYDHTSRALPVIQALHDAAARMRLHRLPELFCGMQRAGDTQPVLYPVSCSPQAWASGAFFMLLQAALGLFPDAPGRILHIRDPRLPTFLRELTLTDLRVGGSRIALQFRRYEERTLANVLAVDGDPLHVRIELS